MRSLSNIFWLGLKELRSFLNDYVLLGLVIYTFTLAVMAQAQSNSQELRNASIAIVDEDRSALSRQIASGFLPPYFKKPVSIQESDIDRLMNLGRFTFVLDIPPISSATSAPAGSPRFSFWSMRQPWFRPG